MKEEQTNNGVTERVSECQSFATKPGPLGQDECLPMSRSVTEQQWANGPGMNFSSFLPSAHQVGERWFKPGCRQLCICEGNNRTRCVLWRCQAQEFCGQQDGIYGCHAQGEWRAAHVASSKGMDPS